MCSLDACWLSGTSVRAACGECWERFHASSCTKCRRSSRGCTSGCVRRKSGCCRRTLTLRQRATSWMLTTRQRWCMALTELVPGTPWWHHNSSAGGVSLSDSSWHRRQTAVTFHLHREHVSGHGYESAARRAACAAAAPACQRCRHAQSSAAGGTWQGDCGPDCDCDSNADP